MEIIAFALSVIMGFTLGLFGGGGSILTIPIMVYILGINPVMGTAYSLFVVGSASMIGGWQKHNKGLVDWKTSIVFALPSLVIVFLTRYYLLPAIPQQLFFVGDYMLSKDVAIMMFFAIIMVLASYSMIWGRERESSVPPPFNLSLIVLTSVLVGFVTALVGAGGGFLIVPALVLLIGLPMKTAIGSSLVIIAINSLFGFTGDIGAGQDIDWVFLMVFTAFSLFGMSAGIFATRYINGAYLKKGFGWFVLFMGVFIILKETVL